MSAPESSGFTPREENKEKLTFENVLNLLIQYFYPESTEEEMPKVEQILSTIISKYSQEYNGGRKIPKGQLDDNGRFIRKTFSDAVRILNSSDVTETQLDLLIQWSENAMPIINGIERSFGFPISHILTRSGRRGFSGEGTRDSNRHTSGNHPI